MVSALYPEDPRPRVLSSFTGVWGVAALVGPMVGKARHNILALRHFW
jgi:hypothetical protein